MVLLDSLYINNSGGKVLLDYLVEKLESSDLDVFYLFDERCNNDYKGIPDDRKIYLKASLLNRFKFYVNKRNTFTKILCFANTPPPINLRADVFTYFHNTLLVDIPVFYSLKNKVKVLLQKYLAFLFKNNSDKWIVQTSYGKELIVKGLKINNKDCLIYPFYNIKKKENLTEKIKNAFCYVSTGAEHKNHNRLLNAWEKLFDEGKFPELYLTIPKVNTVLIDKIIALQEKGVKIHNYGFLQKPEIEDLYSKSEYLIYPSLTESFGLPIIEAINNGCKVVASDLRFVHAIIQPSATFDPYNVESIKGCISTVVESTIPQSKILVEDNINKIIQLLK